jgi:hypothetical protein
MSSDESSPQLPIIIATDDAGEGLKLQDHHQVEVHIPEGNLSQPPSLDPIMEQSAVDLHVIQGKTFMLIIDSLVSEEKEVSAQNKIEHGGSSSSDEAFKSYKQALKDSLSDDEDKEKIKRGASFGQQRAVWHGLTPESSPYEILENSGSDTHSIHRKPSLLQKIFKGEGALVDILSNSFSKHETHSNHSNPLKHSDSLKHTHSFKHDQESIVKDNLHDEEVSSLHSNLSVNYHSGGHHHIQMFHFPESQSRDHWITSNHRDHKHESLLSKIFHVRHDSDRDHKNKLDDVNSSARISTPDELATQNTSTSSVSDIRTSVGSDIRKQVVSPPPDLPKIEHTFSQKLSRFLSKKKHRTDEKEITSNLIKELVLAQNQIQRTDTQSSQMTNTSIMSSAATSDVCLSDKYGHIEEVLGKGAQATVRLAHLHTSKTEKLWAVKVSTTI